MTRRAVWILSSLLLTLAAPAGAEEAVKPVPAEQPAPEEAPAGKAPMAAGESRPTAVDPDPAAAPEAQKASEANLGMPGRTDPAASRGPNGCPDGIQALAPASGVGRTAEESPALQFSLSEPTTCRIELVVNDPRQTAPILEREIPGPHTAGIHVVRLGEFGVKLEPSVRYSWYVQIVPDPAARSKDIFSGAPIERISQAEGELWYDELAARHSRLAAAPEDPIAQEAWRMLLAEQRLEAGTTERDVASGPPR